MQKIKPDNVDVMMYDGGMYWHHKGLHLEAEYLYKHYAHDAFKAVHAVDAFASYDIPTSKKSAIRYVTPLIRYDFMSDHSDGTRYGGSDTELGALKINDYKRHRTVISDGLIFWVLNTRFTFGKRN